MSSLARRLAADFLLRYLYAGHVNMRWWTSSIVLVQVLCGQYGVYSLDSVKVLVEGHVGAFKHLYLNTHNHWIWHSPIKPGESAERIAGAECIVPCTGVL